MHSFTLAFENYFVPDAHLVGGEAGDRPRLLPADGGLRRRPAADRRSRLRASRRRRSRRRRSTSSSASSSGADLGLPADAVPPRADGGDARRGARHHLRGGARRWTKTSARRRRSPRRPSCFACDVAVEVTPARPAPARRLGLRRGVPDQPLRRRRAGAADLRGREADPRAQGRRAQPAVGVELQADASPRRPVSRRWSRYRRARCDRARRPRRCSGQANECEQDREPETAGRAPDSSRLMFH